jgi:hypothetical protein
MTVHANLKLTAKLLPIITPFMAKNDIRYYLNAINVRPHKDGGAVICATNGHVLGAIYDPDAVCEEEVILRFDGRMQQACAAGLKDDRQVVMIGERLAIIESGGAEVCIQAGRPDIEATYPRYERVIPKQETLQPGLVGTYGEAVLSLCQKAAVAAGKIGAGRMKGYSGMQSTEIRMRAQCFAWSFALSLSASSCLCVTNNRRSVFQIGRRAFKQLMTWRA